MQVHYHLLQQTILGAEGMIAHLCL